MNKPTVITFFISLLLNIAIVISLLLVGLAVNTVQAGENYNSSKSNTVTSIFEEEGGLDEEKAQALLDKFETRDGIITIDEDLLKKEMKSLGVSEDRVQRVVSALRENAAEELAAKLPTAGLLPTSPLYFLERWMEAVGEFFTFSPQAKTRLQVKRGLERLAEVVAMLAEKEVEPRGIDIALARLEGNLQKASRIIEDEKNKGRDVSVLAKELDAQFGTQKVFLESAVNKSTERGVVKDLFPASILKVLDSFNQADEQFEEVAIRKKPGRPEVEEGKEEETRCCPKVDMPIKEPPKVEKEKEEEKKLYPKVEIGVPKTAEQKGAVSAARGKNYNSSLSKTHSVGKIREEVGNILLGYGIGGAEINRVTDALERGIDEAELINLLNAIAVPQNGIDKTLLKLDEMGAAFPSQ